MRGSFNSVLMENKSQEIKCSLTTNRQKSKHQMTSAAFVLSHFSKSIWNQRGLLSDIIFPGGAWENVWHGKVH